MSGFDIYKIMNHLPHRYPFLLVDKVLECDPGKTLTALKNVTFNEPFFQGHFPNQPIMPGVLVVEALAQATGLLSFCTMGEEESKNKLYVLTGVDKARFRGQVGPGDQLIMEVTLNRHMRGMWMYSAKAMVNDKVVVNCDLMCSAQEKNK